MAGPASSSPERNWLETSPRTATSPPARVPPLDLDREVAGRADLVHLGPEGAHRVEHVAHRALAHAVGAVDAAVPLAEAGDREQEAAGGARQPGVDDRHVGDGLPGRARARRGVGAAQSASISAPSARSPSTIASVSSACRALVRMLVPVGQRRADQGPVGDALRPGQRRRRRRADPSSGVDGQRVGQGHPLLQRGDRGAVALRPTRPPRRRSAAPASTRRMSTPWSPSLEWAISRSAMLTSSVPASVVTSASTPARSGTGTRTSHRSPAPVSARRAGWRGPRGPARAPSAARRGRRRPRCRAPRRATRARPSSTSTMAVRFSAQMSGQMPGWPDAMRVMSRKPPAARRSRARCSSARSSARRISDAAVRWGTCDTTATSASWRSGASDDHVGAELGDHRPQRGEGASSVAAVGVSTHTAPANRSAIGAVDAVLLGAGHRVAADEAGVVDGVDDRRLHAADVGDEPRPAGQRRRGRVGDRAHRRGEERDLGVGVGADRVERAELEGPRRRRPGSRSSPGDVPAPAAQRQPDRAADEPGADDRRPSRRHSRRAGRRGGRRRLRGTRGAARPGCARW